MSRAAAVRKKPAVAAARAVKAKKAVARVAAPKGRAPVKNRKPAAKTSKIVARAAKPAPKPVAKAPAAKAPAAKAPAAKAPAAKVPAAKASIAKASPSAVPKPGAVPAWKPTGAKAEQRYAGMSEAEIMRAPASQYMNAAQLAFFRERLLSMQRELLEKADLTSEHLREHDIEPDPTDQATIEEEYALELRARDRERKLLKKIEQSLRRIEDGSYGYCEETGDAIGIARMLARPTATLTIEAQSRRELKQKLYGN